MYGIISVWGIGSKYFIRSDNLFRRGIALYIITCFRSTVKESDGTVKIDAFK